MLRLLIQTVLNRVDVVLFSGDIMLAMESWPSQKDEVKQLIPGIELVLSDYGYDWKEIEEIAVVVGKGNFSSTRIGVTVANILSLATGAKIYELEIEGELRMQDILDKALEIMNSGKDAGLAKPVYRSEPMISPSKKKKFTE